MTPLWCELRGLHARASVVFGGDMGAVATPGMDRNGQSAGTCSATKRESFDAEQ